MSTEDTMDVVIAMNRLLRRLRRADRTGGLHPTQFIVLALLAQYGPLRVGEIARRIPCSQPTATTAVASLLAAGFVQREADPTDGRATRVAATEAGLGTLRSLTHSQAEALAALLSTIPADEAHLLLAAAPVLSALVDLPDPSAADIGRDDRRTPISS